MVSVDLRWRKCPCFASSGDHFGTRRHYRPTRAIFTITILGVWPVSEHIPHPQFSTAPNSKPAEAALDGNT